MNSFYKNLGLWLIIGVVMILLYYLSQQTAPPATEIVFSDFLNRVEKGEVAEVVIKLNQISGVLKDGKKFSTYTTDYPNLVDALREKDIKITVKPPDETPWYIAFLFSWGPILLLVGVWIFFMRQTQMGGNRALSFGKSRARLLTEERKKVTFADVAGVDEAKEEV